MRFAIVAVVLAVLAAPAASPAAVVKLGPGSTPAAAIDTAGTAYVAWIGDESLANTLQFCKLPRGATACSVRTQMTTTGNSLTRPYVAVKDSRVAIAQYRYQEKAGDQQGIWLWLSQNGGTSFDGGRQVGTVPFVEGVVGPGDTLSVVTDAVTEGELFQNVGLDGAEAKDPKSATLSSGSDRPYRGAVGMLDATTPLVISTNGADGAAFRRFSGTGDLENDKSWTDPVDIGTLAYPHLAGGTAGLFVSGGTADRMIVARKWTGTTFGDPVTIGPGDVPNSHLFQDGAGRLHAVFNRYDADGLHLEHAVSDGGSAWRAGTVLVQQVSPDGAFSLPRAAVAPDHIGIAVWGASTAKDVRVTPIGPDAPKPVVTVAGGATRAGAGVVIRLSGRLKPPGELTKAQACRDGGKVRLTVKRGRKTVAARSAKVSATCAYKLKTKVPRSRVKAARKLKVKARFGGNDALASAAKTKTIRVR
jgi:hypothetical protein